MQREVDRRSGDGRCGGPPTSWSGSRARRSENDIERRAAPKKSAGPSKCARTRRRVAPPSSKAAADARCGSGRTSAPARAARRPPRTRVASDRRCQGCARRSRRTGAGSRARKSPVSRTRPASSRRGSSAAPRNCSARPSDIERWDRSSTPPSASSMDDVRLFEELGAAVTAVERETGALAARFAGEEGDVRGVRISLEESPGGGRTARHRPRHRRSRPDASVGELCRNAPGRDRRGSGRGRGRSSKVRRRPTCR